MPRDTLFTLPPGFEGRGQREFCPECAEIIGILAYFPSIRDSLSITHVSVSHPRKAITDLLGDGQFNAPTLVLAEGTELSGNPYAKTANGRIYLDSASGICALWRTRYGIPARRGD